MEDSTLKFSNHAIQRQNQRFIPRNDVIQTVSSGNKVNFGWNDVSVHYNKYNKVVTAGNTVVTVVKNERNRRFDALKNSKRSIESLTYQVNVKENDHAMCELAKIYESGELVDRDMDKAHELYMHAALLGNSHAMCNLSSMYGGGSLGKVDKELENKWMLKAADKGNVYALGVTGQKLLLECIKDKTLNGSYCDEAADRAMSYLERAAAKGSTRTMWTIGSIYENGYIKEKDISKAIEYYSRAAITGSPASVESLHSFSERCLYSADKLENILNNLVGYLSKSSIGMLFQIGVSQLNGEVGYSESRGINMIETAAKSTNFVKAMITLSKIYRDGKHCKADLRLCQYWYNRVYSLCETSAKEGNVDSLWMMGKFHMKGYVGDIDLEKAESIFKKVVMTSNQKCFMFMLGRMYTRGLLGNKDPKVGEEMIKEALLLKEKTAKEGNAEDCYVISSYYASNKYSFHSFEKAVLWATESVKLGDLNAEILLSKIYLNKCSGYTNIAEGLRIIKKKILSRNISFFEGYLIIRDYLKLKEYEDWLKEMVQMRTKEHLDVSSFAHLRELASDHCNTDDDLFVLNSLMHLARSKSEDISDNEKYLYLYRLFTEFKKSFAMFKLCNAHIEGVLPDELIAPVTKWMTELPELILHADDHMFFFMGASLLEHLFKIGTIHPVNLMESAKWLCICEVKDIEQDAVMSINILENMSDAYSKIKEEFFKSGFVASALDKLIQNFKSNYPSLFKLLCRMLGDVFYGGYLVERDIEKAILWYSEASAMNNSRATLTLAQIYRFYEEKINLYRSLRYYKLAVKQGSQTAVEELTTLIHENDKFNTHLSFLSNYQHKSSISDDIISETVPFKKLTKYPSSSQEIYELGMKYLNEENPSSDCLNNAMFWLRKASKRSHIKATAELYLLYSSGKAGSQVLSLANVYKRNLLMNIRFRLKIKASNSFYAKTGNLDKLIENLCDVIEVLTKLNGESIFQQLLECINGLTCSNVVDILSQARSLCKEAISNINKSITQHI